MEPIRIDLKNSIVVGSVSGNTKPMVQDMYLFHECVLTIRVRVQVQVLSHQVQIRVHCFQVQVLSTTTRANLTPRTALLKTKAVWTQNRTSIMHKIPGPCGPQGLAHDKYHHAEYIRTQ